jgi:hypothetical protein
VSHLYVDESAEKIGEFERDGYRTCGEEDLLNLAMIATVINRGKACTLPAPWMPDKSIAIGFMRFELHLSRFTLFGRKLKVPRRSWMCVLAVPTVVCDARLAYVAGICAEQ